MSAAVLLLAALLLRPCLWADDSRGQAPSFSSDSIVNSANGSPASLTPSVIATVYGSNLAFSTEEVSIEHVGAGTLPISLGGVRILIGSRFAPLLFVSPTQINFVIPADLLADRTVLFLDRQGTFGQAQITLLDAAPGLYVVDNGKLAATHANGKLITSEFPASPGEIIVVYGTGLGRTNPRQVDGVIPRSAATAVARDRLRVLLDGQTLPDVSILYAGITPGYPGLYQINLRLPDRISKKDPELRVAVGDQMSQSSLKVPVAPGEP